MIVVKINANAGKVNLSNEKVIGFLISGLDYFSFTRMYQREHI